MYLIKLKNMFFSNCKMYLSQITKYLCLNCKMYLSQIAKCICLKLQNVFVSNCKKYLPPFQPRNPPEVGSKTAHSTLAFRQNHSTSRRMYIACEAWGCASCGLFCCLMLFKFQLDFHLHLEW